MGGLSSSVFILMAYLVHIILSFFIPSTSGLATVSMPLMGPGGLLRHLRDLVITAYQSASGWINLFAPHRRPPGGGAGSPGSPDRFGALGAARFIIGVGLITMVVLVAGPCSTADGADENDRQQKAPADLFHNAYCLARLREAGRAADNLFSSSSGRNTRRK